jgi:hypothetical protein
MAYESPSFEGSAPVLPMTDLSAVSMAQRPGVSIPDAYGDDYENPNPRSPIGRTIAEYLLGEAALGAHGRADVPFTDRTTAGGW